MPAYLKRVRHELKVRTLSVNSIEKLSPLMLRIIFTGEDLSDFTSASPDDHIKLLFQGKNGENEGRDYTPRSFDNSAQTLTIDFALHESGIATDWAINAKVGDNLRIGGPKGSSIIEGDIDWWVLIGDETAIPTIARRLEEMPKGTKVTTFIAITSEAEKQTLSTNADLTQNWIIRPEQDLDNAQPFLDALSCLTLPQGEGFIWVAAEGNVVRKIRDYLNTEKNHPKQLMKASGYWVSGKANTTAKFED